MAKFATNLRELMEERGVTAAEISAATGIPRSSISEYLVGRQPKLNESLVRLAKFLGVSVERLITGKEPEETLVEDLLASAEEVFMTLHEGTYRVRVEKRVEQRRTKK